MLTGTLPILYFGKVPVHGDFVRHNAGGTALRAMDAWLQQGLHNTRILLAGGLDAAYDAAAPFCFHFASRDAEPALVGVLQPSRDSVGRMYPLLIALEVDAAAFDARHLAQVPLQFEAFFKQAATVASDAAKGRLSRPDLTTRTEALSGLVGEDAQRVAFYSRYLQQTSLTAFWERLWGHPQDSRKYLLFKNLLDILLPLRDGIPAGYPLLLRFPLCPDGHTLDFDVSFWLGLCLRLLGYPDVQPTFFWNLPGEAGGPEPFLWLALRPTTPRTLAHLFSDGVESDTLCELEKMGAQNAALAALAIPDRYGRMLEDERLTLWDFLKQL